MEKIIFQNYVGAFSDYFHPETLDMCWCNEQKNKNVSGSAKESRIKISMSMI